MKDGRPIQGIGTLSYQSFQVGVESVQDCINGILFWFRNKLVETKAKDGVGLSIKVKGSETRILGNRDECTVDVLVTPSFPGKQISLAVFNDLVVVIKVSLKA
jgi:hypothetical protein